MKKILPIICALAAVLTAACSKDDTGGKGGGGDKPSTVSVTGVSLDKSTMTLTVGKAESLVATVSPSNATNKNVTWSSDSESIARVSNGIVTAIAVGTATIKVTTADGDKTATCKVTVTDKQVPAVNFDISPKTITVGGTTNLGVTVEPSTIKVRYKSSDPSVVTVDENGNVTAVGPGTATITIYTDETADCAPVSKTLGVTVTEKQTPKVNIDITPRTITVGGTTNLGVTVEPSTIKVRYKSSDPSVVTVDENGNVTAVGPGTATITIYTDETADCAPVSKTLSVTVVEGTAPLQPENGNIQGWGGGSTRENEI